MAELRLLKPSVELLNSYAAALANGWDFTLPSPREQLAVIAADPAGFLRSREDRLAKGPNIRLPNGDEVPRLPGFHRWLSDDDFAGDFGVRWQPGTNDLPDYVLGHVGYGVIPEKRQRGYATRGLALLLGELAQDEDVALDYVELTTNWDNVASKRVIEANGGELIEEFFKTPQHGGGRSLRYRIALG